MTHPSPTSLCDSATVFVVRDVLKSVEHYRDVLGFHTEFTYGEPTFYAGVERDGVTIHLQAASETKRQPGHVAPTSSPSGWSRRKRANASAAPRRRA